MPKLRTPKATPAQRRAAVIAETTKIIDHAMTDKGLRYYKDAAPLVGMSAATFSSKMRNGTWTQSDLCELVRVLGIGQSEALKLLGVGV